MANQTKINKLTNDPNPTRNENFYESKEKILKQRGNENKKLSKENAKRRTVISTEEAKLYPHNLAVRLDLLFKNGEIDKEGVIYGGSGFWCGPIIITAAHNLYHEKTKQDVSQITIVFSNGKKLIASDYYYPKEYLKNEGHHAFDWGIIRWWTPLKKPYKSKSEIKQELNQARAQSPKIRLGYDTINHPLEKCTFVIAGYPVYPDDPEIEEQVNKIELKKSDQIESLHLSLIDEVKKQKFNNNETNGIFKHNGSTSGGQSGSYIYYPYPFLEPIRAVGIHVSGDTEFNNVGALLTSSVISKINIFSLDLMNKLFKNYPLKQPTNSNINFN